MTYERTIRRIRKEYEERVEIYHGRIEADQKLLAMTKRYIDTLGEVEQICNKEAMARKEEECDMSIANREVEKPEGKTMVSLEPETLGQIPGEKDET